MFVDAGYFWVQALRVVLGSRLGAKQPRDKITLDYSALHVRMLSAVNEQCVGGDLLRVYWYDGPGAAGGGKTQHHIAIDGLDDFKLRLGVRNGIGMQKAVDGLIIADLISLAQAKAISHALLVSGDADLAPGVIAAQALGIRVHLMSMGPDDATSPYLAAEADRKCRLSDEDVHRFATKTVDNEVTESTVSRIQEAKTAPVESQPSLPLTHSAAPTREGATALAKAALNRFDDADLARAAKGSSLVNDLDKRLIAWAIDELGRKLEPAERNALRAAFRAEARARVTLTPSPDAAMP